MPLAHFVSEAKRNTPSLVKRNETVTETHPALSETAIGAEPETQRAEVKRTMAEISEGEKARIAEKKPEPAWKSCQYLKDAGERMLCTQYMSWCAQDKCQKKFMETDFFDFKRHLKQGKPIK